MWTTFQVEISIWQPFRAIAVLTIMILAWAASSLAQQSPFDSYTDKIASDIEAQRKKFLFPRVLVIDFPFSVTGMENLSLYLADDLSHSLESKLPAGTVIPRAQLREFLLSHWLTPTTLSSISDAAWAAEKLGANEMIYGEITASDNALNLNLRLMRLADRKDAANWKLSLLLTDQLKAQKGKKLEWQLPPGAKELALRCASDGAEGNTKLFAEAGGTMPKAIYTPNPPYSNEARKQRLEGTRSYDIFIDKKGHPVLAIPHRPVVPALDDIAVETIAKWKFQPATMNGMPVAVCEVVEVFWRLY